MTTYIALFRGINVGGRNRLPMRELVSVLEELGLQAVRTYIQSGNVIFQSDAVDTAALGDRISAAIGESHGFSPRVLVLRRGDLESAMAANPFSEAEGQPKSLHLHFLASVPKDPDLATLEEIKRDSERFALKGKAFYLHAPDGVGRSKLAARVERALGVPATARNWRTVSKIREMVRDG